MNRERRKLVASTVTGYVIIGLVFLAYTLSLVSCRSEQQYVEDIPLPECEQPDVEIQPVGYFDTQLQGFWSSTPDVRICPSSGITKQRVKTAMRFWEDLGYEFGEIITPPYGPEICTAKIGEIAFRLPTQQELSNAINTSRLGVAQTMIHGPTGRIVSSDIYFQTVIASQVQKIVEHEIGHALGWEHHNYSGHIMHRELANSGWGSVGLEKRRYNSLVRELKK